MPRKRSPHDMGDEQGEETGPTTNADPNPSPPKRPKPPPLNLEATHARAVAIMQAASEGGSPQLLGPFVRSDITTPRRSASRPPTASSTTVTRRRASLGSSSRPSPPRSTANDDDLPDKKPRPSPCPKEKPPSTASSLPRDASSATVPRLQQDDDRVDAIAPESGAAVVVPTAAGTRGTGTAARRGGDRLSFSLAPLLPPTPPTTPTTKNSRRQSLPASSSKQTSAPAAQVQLPPPATPSGEGSGVATRGSSKTPASSRSKRSPSQPPPMDASASAKKSRRQSLPASASKTPPTPKELQPSATPPGKVGVLIRGSSQKQESSPPDAPPSPSPSPSPPPSEAASKTKSRRLSPPARSSKPPAPSVLLPSATPRGKVGGPTPGASQGKPASSQTKQLPSQSPPTTAGKTTSRRQSLPSSPSQPSPPSVPKVSASPSGNVGVATRGSAKTPASSPPKRPLLSPPTSAPASTTKARRQSLPASTLQPWVQQQQRQQQPPPTTRGTPIGKVGVPKRSVLQKPTSSPPKKATAQSASVLSEERPAASSRKLSFGADNEPRPRLTFNNRQLVDEAEDDVADVDTDEESLDEAHEDVDEDVDEDADEDEPEAIGEVEEPVPGWKTLVLNWKSRVELWAVDAVTFIRYAPTTHVFRFVFLVMIAAAVFKGLRGHRASVVPQSNDLRCSLTSSHPNDPNHAFACAVGEAQVCPPHGVCEAGVVVACEPSSNWVLETSGTPTRCVLSDAARAKVALVTGLLEAWSWPRSCANDHPFPQRVQGAPPPFISSPVALFNYSTIQPFVALHGERSPSHRLDTLTDENEFANAAQGYLHLQVVNRERGAPFLVVGLLPNHSLPLPLSCRVGKFAVVVINASTSVLYGSIKWLIVSLLVNGLAYPTGQFIKQTLWIIYSECPFAAVGLPLTASAIAMVAYVVHQAHRRHKEMLLETEVEADCQRALGILSHSERPILISQLSGVLSENHKDTSRFEQVVWPQALQRLESDERISIWTIGGEKALSYEG